MKFLRKLGTAIREEAKLVPADYWQILAFIVVTVGVIVVWQIIDAI